MFCTLCVYQTSLCQITVSYCVHQGTIKKKTYVKTCGWMILSFMAFFLVFSWYMWLISWVNWAYFFRRKGLSYELNSFVLSGRFRSYFFLYITETDLAKNSPWIRYPAPYPREYRTHVRREVSPPAVQWYMGGERLICTRYITLIFTHVYGNHSSRVCRFMRYEVPAPGGV